MRVNIAQLKTPWHCIDAEHQAFEAELHRELPGKHQLYGKPSRAIARRDDCDDVLFLFDDFLAVVHLTYAGRERDPAWPATEIFEDWEHFLRHRMEPDVIEYDDGAP